MIMSHPALEEPLKFIDGKANMIVVENETMFFNLISDLCRQIEGDSGSFIVSDNECLIDMYKKSDIVLSPFIIDLNNRTHTSSMHKELCSIAVNENNSESLMKLLSEIQNFIDELRLNTDVEIEYDEPTIDSLLKALNIRFHESDDLIEKLCDYITLCSTYGKKKLIIFVNVCTFFTDDQISLILNHAFNVKIHVLLMEHYLPYRLPIVNVRTIDKDLCEF